MRDDIKENLFSLTDEEQNILDGGKLVNKSLYTDDIEFIVDINKMLLPHQLISIRKHTRFIEFPKHKHNYIEFSYVYNGSLTQIIDNNKITLNQGELIFLNQSIVHEIEETSESDIIINFIINPEFFKYIFSLDDGNNVIFNFLVKTIYCNYNDGEYLYFKVSDQKSIQEIMEKIITEMYNPSVMSTAITKLLVGLLVIELMRNPKDIEIYAENNFEKMLNIQVLKYIDDSYINASLYEISEILKQPHYKISKLIKKETGYTFKKLVQEKRLNKVAELLKNSNLSIIDIMHQVGYENTTYFYNIFKEKFGVTPKVYKSNTMVDTIKKNIIL